METASTYFTRRARQERANAAEANSAEARKAHIELALRLVRVATERSLWSQWTRSLPGGTAAQHQTSVATGDLGNALADAFPLPPSGAFRPLLDAVDESTSTAVTVELPRQR